MRYTYERYALKEPLSCLCSCGAAVDIAKSILPLELVSGGKLDVVQVSSTILEVQCLTPSSEAMTSW